MSRYDLSLVNAGPNTPRHTDGRMLKPPPLGIVTLAGFLKSKGRSVQVLDYQLNSYPVEDQLRPSAFVRYLEERVEAPVLGISTMGGMMPVVLLALEQYRRRHPETTVVLGGPGPTSAAPHLLRDFSSVDYVVNGEGEWPLLDILDHGRQPANIPGISYRSGNTIAVNPSRAPIRDLDSLPPPAWETLPMDRYVLACIVTARGCPYRCSFCEVPSFWGKRMTLRGIDRVVEEIRTLRYTYGKRRINISDDTFVHHRGRVVEFCRRLIEEDLDIQWECFGRVNLMDEDLMNLMARAGCSGIFYGIESGAENVLQRIDKRITVKQAIHVVEMSLKYFKRVVTSFIWGFPFETQEQFFDTVILMMACARMGAQVQRPYLTLRPLTPLYREFKEQLTFADDLPLHFLEVSRRHIPTEVIDLIRRHPTLFPGYYYVEEPNFGYKKRFMQKLEDLGKDRWNILHDWLYDARPAQGGI